MNEQIQLIAARIKELREIAGISAESFANELSFDERVEEISRMISLDEIGEDAKNYAIKLLKECQNG